MIDLSQLSFFQNFPQSLLETLNQCVEVLKLKSNDILLAQGQVNDSLYFLIKGELLIYVDGRLVANLNNQGDLVGEMSLITQQNSSAEIRAKEFCELYKIDGNELNTLMDKAGDEIQFNLYRIYADILAQKLETTNQRAKLAEDLNSELEAAQSELKEANSGLEKKVRERTSELESSNRDLKQKNVEILASHDKMKDLFRNHELTFQSLESILVKQLKPLQEEVNDLGLGTENEKSLNRSAVKYINQAVRQLEPLTQSYGAERSMDSKRVLMAESNRKQQTVAKMALGGTGVQLDVVNNVDEANERLKKNEYDIVIFNEEMTQVAEAVQKSKKSSQLVFVTSEDVANYLPKVLELPFFPNIVSRDENDRQFTIKNIVTTVSKLASGNYFGLEKYLSWGVDVQEKAVSSSEQRYKLTAEMEDYFKKIGIRTTLLTKLTVVTEELLMNAIYDAPRDSNGKPIFNHLERTNSVELAPDQQAILRFASDGVLMAISVEDPFGGLDAETVFRYLERCYAGGSSLNEGNSEKGGGGRGLHQIVEHSDLVVFNILPNRRTEVIALFNTDHKVAQVRNPNLHFFTYKD